MGKILQILIIENRDLAYAQTFCTRVARDLKESMAYFIIMIYLFFYRIKLHNAII